MISVLYQWWYLSSFYTNLLPLLISDWIYPKSLYLNNMKNKHVAMAEFKVKLTHLLSYNFNQLGVNL